MPRKIIALLVAILALVALTPSPAPAGGDCCPCACKLGKYVEKFKPVFVQEQDIPAEPERLLYRAAVSPDCKTLYLAYHVVWPYEQDPRQGFWPTVTRLTYTGGLKFQRLIYGKGDTEVIEIHVDLATGQIVRIRYETADYDAKGSVIHREVVLDGNGVPSYSPLAFKVASWNHLFEMMEQPPGEGDKVYDFPPEPFTEEIWKEYRMTEKHKSALLRDRDHPAWEDGQLCMPGETSCPCKAKG